MFFGSSADSHFQIHTGKILSLDFFWFHEMPFLIAFPLMLELVMDMEAVRAFGFDFICCSVVRGKTINLCN